MKHIGLISDALNILGIFLNVVGTYLMANAYISHTAKSGVLLLLRVTFLYLTFQKEKARRIIRAEAKLGKTGEDDINKLDLILREETILGLFLLFLGFMISFLTGIYGFYQSLIETFSTVPS